MGVSNWGDLSHTPINWGEIRTNTKKMASGKKGLSNRGGKIKPALTLFFFSDSRGASELAVTEPLAAHFGPKLSTQPVCKTSASWGPQK